MIEPSSVASSSGSSSKNRPYSDSDTESDSDMSDTSEDEDDSLSESENDDEPVKLLKSNWPSVGLEKKEDDIKGSWYGVIYREKKKKKTAFFIAKILNRLLEDVDGPVKSLYMVCLMAKLGSGNELKE